MLRESCNLVLLSENLILLLMNNYFPLSWQYSREKSYSKTSSLLVVTKQFGPAEIIWLLSAVRFRKGLQRSLGGIVNLSFTNIGLFILIWVKMGVPKVRLTGRLFVGYTKQKKSPTTFILYHFTIIVHTRMLYYNILRKHFKYTYVHRV